MLFVVIFLEPKIILGQTEGCIKNFKALSSDKINGCASVAWQSSLPKAND